MFPTLPLTPEPILSILNDFKSFSLADAVDLSEMPEDYVQDVLDLLVSCEMLEVSCLDSGLWVYERMD